MGFILRTADRQAQAGYRPHTVSGPPEPCRKAELGLPCAFGDNLSSKTLVRPLIRCGRPPLCLNARQILIMPSMPIGNSAAGAWGAEAGWRASHSFQ